MFEEFRGKNAFVTGGSRGIGECIVKTLAKYGTNVAFTYITSPVDMPTYRQGLDNSCGKIIQYKMDVCDIKNIRSVIDDVEKELGNIHYLINNAGITKDKFMMLMGKTEWDQVININLTGTFLVTKEILLSMISNKEGVIVNISSIAGLKGVAGQANYCASKSGIIGLTKALALEVSGKNIRVNAVAPGYVDTDMLQTMKLKIKEDVCDKIPLKRVAHPDEIASVVLFLLSNSASYITGTTIPVDGGLVN